MRKAFVFFLLVTMVLTVSACGKQDDSFETDAGTSSRDAREDTAASATEHESAAASAAELSDPSVGSDPEQSSQQESLSESAISSVSDNDQNGFGKTILFGGFEITVSEQYTFVTVENSFSKQNGMDVAELPVHIKNVGDETDKLYFLYYRFYGPRGDELEDVDTYFDNDIYRAGDLAPGEEYDTYFHLFYDGDGVYSIKFQNEHEKQELAFEIKK